MSIMICLAGMPGSGKTTWALEFLKRHPDYLYFSPDAYYERINGDDRKREHPFEIWMAMFRDIHTAEMNGDNVLIDSDNLSYAQRNQWVEWFPDFDARFLLYLEESFDTCMDRVSKRKRTIPELIMREKWYKWENPEDSADVQEWDWISKVVLGDELEKELEENVNG